MSGTVVVGTQWGDEGKAKVVDLLSEDSDLVVRYQGGHNAGHTVVVGDRKFAFRLTPSGILYDHVTPVIGNGVVLHVPTLFAELDMLAAADIDTSRLRVSTNAHLIMPWHIMLDVLAETRRGEKALGTTKNGIGPAYVDKVAREGIRVQDLLDPVRFRDRLRFALDEKNVVLTKVYDADPINEADILGQYLDEIAPRLAPYVCDTVDLIHRALTAEKVVLFEGAQATFLDIDHGTYPFVTSSNPVAGAACAGAGVGPRDLTRIVGIAKAYVTRVGAGPFPTELHDSIGGTIIEKGHEFGTVTGRRRHAGWFDAVMMRQAVRLNSLTELAVMKLDILDGFESVKICVAYDIDGSRHEFLPSDLGLFSRAVPVYEEFAGWNADTSSARSFAELPATAQAFLSALAARSGVRISLVGVGPERDQMLAP